MVIILQYRFACKVDRSFIMSLCFLADRPPRSSVHSFLWTDLVTTISHERFQQSWWNLQRITVSPYDNLFRLQRSKVKVTADSSVPDELSLPAASLFLLQLAVWHRLWVRACSCSYKTTSQIFGNLTSGQRIFTKDRVACGAVIEDWIIPFAAYTAAETPVLFSRSNNPQNCPF